MPQNMRNKGPGMQPGDMFTPIAVIGISPQDLMIESMIMVMDYCQRLQHYPGQCFDVRSTIVNIFTVEIANTPTFPCISCRQRIVYS